MKNIFIDCRVGMYAENAVRVLATVDVQNDTVTISQIMPYYPPADPFKDKTPQQVEIIKMINKNSVVVVDNPDAFNNWDLRFIEEQHLGEAVQAYYLLENTKSLVLDKALINFNPRNILETRKMDMKGNVYELNSDEINNTYMVVLIVCWAAVKARNTHSITVNESPTQEDTDEFFVPFSV